VECYGVVQYGGCLRVTTERRGVAQRYTTMEKFEKFAKKANTRNRKPGGGKESRRYPRTASVNALSKFKHRPC